MVIDFRLVDTSKLAGRLAELGGLFDLFSISKRLAELEIEIASPSFWKDRVRAEGIVCKASELRSKLLPFHVLQKRLEELEILQEIAVEESSQELRVSAAVEVSTEYQRLVEELSRFELVQFFSGEFDRNSAFLTVHSGAGGVESCDWARMLIRMYTRWIERSPVMKYEEVSFQEAEGGVRYATLRVCGEFAYGYLRQERGVHRLVRISPFDANRRRHTSFASVDVVPEIEEVPIHLEERDLKIDTYRSSGKGGQNVNKVETAVRITHCPTGVVASCQNERSQLKNRHTALKLLKAKLYQIEIDKKLAERNTQSRKKGTIGWGNQIRSYVFQPYQLVKDLRTGVQATDVHEVMDGGIQSFIEGHLLHGLTRAENRTDSRKERM
ncbi:MAG: peptide chain release factor 2 [Candidatus Xiphinematobacter sp.]|nr:MAG: peptide chain release factor 2 [Candidatus Xiphinematobacter sp.]